jgi:hypothetical protein
MALISSMIAELSTDVNSFGQEWRRNNEPEDALARSRCENGRPSAVEQQWQKNKHTFSVDPQEGTRGLPLLERIALEEPFGGTLVASLAYHTVIR